MIAIHVVALFLRRLRSESIAVAGLMTLVLATALVFGAAPRLLSRVGDDALRTVVAGYPVPLRNLGFDEQTRICACTPDPFADVEAEGANVEARVPPTLGSTIVDRVAAADTTRWSVVRPEQFPPVLTIRFEPRAFDHIRLVEGRLPAGAPRTITVPATPTDAAASSPVYEVVLAQASAAKIGVHVGETLFLRPDRTDRLASRSGLPVRAAIEVVGIYAVPDPDEAFWFGEPALLHPTIRTVSSEVEFVDVFALAAPAAYPAYLAATSEAALPLTYHWHLSVDVGRLDGANTGQVQADLRRAESIFPASAFGSGGPVLRSSLLSILVRQDGEWQSALAVVTAISIGPATVAGAAIALVALLTAQRRRATARLWRARGGSQLQLVVSALAEAFILTVPAGIIAAVATVLVLPGGSAWLTIFAVAGVVVAATAIIAATVLPAVRGGLVTAGPTSGRPSGGGAIGAVGRRRLVLELLVVGVAATAIWLLRERSVHGTGGAGAVGIDPLVAAAPALGGIAAGLIAMRVVALPMAALARIAGSGRGLVAVLAVRRATRGGGAGVVLLVLLATAMIGAFSSGALVLLDRSAVSVAWHDVGAPIRVAAPGSLGGFDASAVPGVQAVAAAYRAPASVGSAGLPLTLLALDPAAYERVVDDLPVDASLPPELAATPDTLPAGSPLPAVVSTALATNPAGVRSGATFTLVVDGRQTTFRATAVRDAFPTLDPSTAFVIASRPQLEALRHAPLVTTDAFIRAPDDALGAITDAATRATTAATITGRAAETEELRQSPIVRAVVLAVAAAAVVAAAYAALAVAAALALASAARTTETAILRTFGLSRREAVGLVVAEHGPLVALAFAVGVGLGFALFLVLQPGLGLSGIIGSDLDVPVAVEPLHLALLLGLIVVIATVGIGLGALIQQRALLAAAVRRGIE
ncbi:MAG TPA: FtsX-like permease family protein [Candidatus Limnocylindrales bacterium]|nr:FtsX-like permease family protein [Candidatus Limnocylindrales bacterium]